MLWVRTSTTASEKLLASAGGDTPARWLFARGGRRRLGALARRDLAAEGEVDVGVVFGRLREHAGDLKQTRVDERRGEV